MEIQIKEQRFDLERLQREVNILLISDLHYDIKKESSTSQDQLLRGNNINKSLVKSIGSAGLDWEPDIVIVAGDLVNQNIEENYAHYFQLIEELVRKYPNLRYTIFSTPGNHDIDRKDFLKILPYMFSLYDERRNLKNSFTGNRLVDMLYTVSKKKFADVPGLQEKLEDFENDYFGLYLRKRKELEESYPTTAEPLLAPLDVTYPVGNFKTVYFKKVHGVTLVCHNSSFFCNLSQAPNDRNNLFLIRDLVEKTLDAIPQSGPVISFMHHPFYYLHESEHVAPVPPNGKDDEYNNFTKIVRSSDLLLSGHVHGDLHDPSYLQNSAYMITNGTSYTADKFEDEFYPCTYAIIKVNKQLNKFSLKKFVLKEVTVAGKRQPAWEEPATHDSKRNYNFLARDHAEATAVETEKVRTLDYFASLKEYSGDTLPYEFFILQLRLYQKEIKSQPFPSTYQVVSRPIASINNKVIAISGDFPFEILVIRVDEQDYMPSIKKLLVDGLETFDPGTSVVYFSVNRSLLKEKEQLSSIKIETLHRFFHSLVLMSKREYVSINLLYH